MNSLLNDIERIQSALAYVPPHDRDTWLRMGMAIKSELDDAGFDTWDGWSQEADSYDPADARSVWRSIRPNGRITLGTLFYEAKANGWRDDGEHRKPSSEELAERKRVASQRAARDAIEIDRERDATAQKAAAVWKSATEAKPNHPYLLRKHVNPVPTLREIEANTAAVLLGYSPKSKDEPLTGRLLVVPIKQGDRLFSLELIDSDGHKAALAGRGSKAGGYWATEPLSVAEDCLLIGEGVATVLSAREATGHPAIAALSSGNLLSIATGMRDRYPTAMLIILADLDKETGEPDSHAIEAAHAVGGKLAIPAFGADRNPAMKDFNDMVKLCGAEAVQRAIAEAVTPSRVEAPTSGSAAGDPPGWPKPLPIVAMVSPEPYPIDALPSTIRAAVQEVAGFVKAPIPMVACSALAALSLAAQAHADIVRADKLKGPIGLFLLTIADSGERKSTCDGFFVTAIRQYQDEQAEAMKPALDAYHASIAGWEAERDGILSAIKVASKSGKPADALKRDLAEMQQDKPQAPRVPRMLLGDETPENLAWGLSKNWPSAGVISAEAGIVFGAHGMGKDSVMRNLALLNVLWDGGSHSVGRRTSESFTVQGARLTVALQIQEATLNSFVDRSGGLARGTGFLARFLVSWPTSTQGYRPFTEAPQNWPHLAEFHKRIAAILADPVPMDEEGRLTPSLMVLSPEAKAAWVAFHDAIERELASGGELYDVRDVASKSADNAARLAALFQIFEHGADGPVRLECIESASRIAAWHLNESRRFFGELALPLELAAAARLDSWLIEHCRRNQIAEVATRDAQRLGPVRDRQKIEAALRELEELGRARLVTQDRRKSIAVNAALLEVPA